MSATRDPDIRWLQRLQKYRKEVGQLARFLDRIHLNELEEQGLIQAFEYTYELAWNVIKDYFFFQGVTGITGSRDAFRLAFQKGLVEEGQVWMDMIRSRQLTSHTYEETLADEMVKEIRERYAPAFFALRSQLDRLAEQLERD